MIISKKVIIKVNSRNFHHYRNFINDIKNNKYYEIEIENILPTSHQKIEVKCDICDKISIKPYRQYMSSYKNMNIYCCSPKCALFKNKESNLKEYGCENSFQSDLIKLKIKQTNLLKYGVEYPSQSDDIRSKIQKTLNENYGVENPAKSEEIKLKIKKTCIDKYDSHCFLSSEKMKLIRIKNGTKIPDELKTEYEKYRDKVRYLTNKLKKYILETWDGFDYYDGEYIRGNFKYRWSNKKYPTMDHKVSIYFGFINNIKPEEISDTSNICITKRGINSSKNSRSIH